MGSEDVRYHLVARAAASASCGTAVMRPGSEQHQQHHGQREDAEDAEVVRGAGWLECGNSEQLASERYPVDK